MTKPKPRGWNVRVQPMGRFAKVERLFTRMDQVIAGIPEPLHFMATAVVGGRRPT